jgi:hypothetical protein
VLQIVENVRRKQLAWVNATLLANGWKPTNLARISGFDPSTLSRFLADPLNKAQLNSTVVQKIALAGGIPPYLTEPPTQQRGFAESEATPYVAEDNAIAAAVAGFQVQGPAIDAWVMKSRALEFAGYLPGDVLVVDMNATPRDGDTVCAQLYDRQGQAETAFRIYEKPFLVAASADAALRRPVLIDGERAIVRGVVVASLRNRKTS